MIQQKQTNTKNINFGVSSFIQELFSLFFQLCPLTKPKEVMWLANVTTQTRRHQSQQKFLEDTINVNVVCFVVQKLFVGARP